MPASLPPWAVLLMLAAALLAGGLLAVRASGARVGLARRLAGAREVRVGDAFDLDPLPDRPVRLVGRIRCPDPIVTDRDDRLVALHRDVEVRLPGRGWRSIERVRETRGFELWDHDGSLPVDPAAAAEPLIAIPHVWRGTTAELAATDHRASLDRLMPAESTPLPARSTTRVLSTVDRLLVLAELRREGGGVALAPPPGGYVISALELPDAMRLLGAPRRRVLLGGAGLVGVGMLLGLVALVLALFTGLG